MGEFSGTSMLSFCYFKEEFAAHAVINYYLSLLLLLLDFYESEKSASGFFHNVYTSSSAWLVLNRFLEP